jgi:hypothetical protein
MSEQMFKLKAAGLKAGSQRLAKLQSDWVTGEAFIVSRRRFTHLQHAHAITIMIAAMATSTANAGKSGFWIVAAS